MIEVTGIEHGLWDDIGSERGLWDDIGIEHRLWDDIEILQYSLQPRKNNWM